MICRYCRDQIPDGAKLCKNCKSYQNVFRNWLGHFGAVAAVATVVGSLIVYSVSTGSKFYREQIMSDDLRILTFKSSGAQTYLNAGGREVHVSHVALNAPRAERARVIRLNRALPPGRFLVEDRTKKSKDFVLVHGLTTRQENTFLERNKERAECISDSYMIETDPAYALYDNWMKSSGDTLTEFDGGGVLYYYSNRGELQHLEFEVKLVFFLNPTKQCRDWFGSILRADDDKSQAAKTVDSDK